MIESRPSRSAVATDRRSGWPWFLAWAAAGAVFVVGLVGSFGVLVLLLPIGGAALAALALRTRVWPEAVGLATGLGGLLLLVAYTNRNYAPCPIEPTTVTRLPGYRAPVCGGIDPVPWLVVGIVVVVVSIGIYASQRLRHRASPT